MKKLLIGIILFSSIAAFANGGNNCDKDWEVDIPWKKSKFDGHFSAIEIGMNTYLNKDYETTLPSNYEFLELNTGKSWGVNLNIAEVNFALIGKSLGLNTGMKFQFNNYRFDQNITLTQDSSVVWYVEETNYTYNKTKLTSTYLLVPIMLEIKPTRDKKLHFAIGAEAGIKLGSHTKVVYKDNGEKMKDKNKEDFYLSPFRYNAVAKVGYDDISVFANYSLSTLFEKDKGPELYPFMVGIAFNF